MQTSSTHSTNTAFRSCHRTTWGIPRRRKSCPARLGTRLPLHRRSLATATASVLVSNSGPHERARAQPSYVSTPERIVLMVTLLVGGGIAFGVRVRRPSRCPKAGKLAAERGALLVS